MRITFTLMSRVGKFSTQYSNLPESYVKRAMKQARFSILFIIYIEKTNNSSLLAIRCFGKHQKIYPSTCL